MNKELRKIKDLQVNEEIRSRQVRLIGPDGEQIGIVSKNEALDRAFDAGLDLVNVAPKAKPPVCRILDYGKYKYEEEKKEKRAKKKQAVINVKEVRMTPNIDTHDIETKAKKANKFFDDGDRVKVSIRFRGREMAHKAQGEEVLNQFKELTKEHGFVDKKPNMEGRNMVMFMSPNTEE